MNNSSNSDLKDSQDKKWKQIWHLENKYLVLIDESIIQKLGINYNDITFVEQEVNLEDNTILMKIKKL